MDRINYFGFLSLCAFCWIVPGVLPMHCYVCEDQETNSPCMVNSTLKGCPEGFDTCQTIVTYSDITEKLSIYKTCSKNASCSIQKLEMESHLECDTSKDSWLCSTCCYESGCNRNIYTSGSQHNHITNARTPVILLNWLFIILCFIYFTT